MVARRSNSSRIALVLPLLFGSGCSPTDQPKPTHIARDSAQVRIVENLEPLWDDDGAWQVETTPILQIGTATGDGLAVFSEITGVATLSDGRIVVSDNGSRTIRFFGPDGSPLGSTGGAGEGPGEYQRLSHMSVLSGDSILVMDLFLQRMTVLGPEGSFVRMARLPTAQLGGMANPHGGWRNGTEVLSVWTRAPDANGLQRMTSHLYTYDLGTEEASEIISFPGPQEFLEGTAERFRSVAYTFGVDTEIAVSAAGILLMSTDEPRVTQVSPDGETRLIWSWPAHSTLVTQELLTAAMEERIAAFPAGVPSGAIERLRTKRLDETVAPQLPTARSLVSDAEGNTWVESFPVPGEGQASYQVFRPDGVWLGGVSLPSGLKRGVRSNFDPTLEIGSDYVLSVWVNDLGVEFVRQYRLKRSVPDRSTSPPRG